MRQLWKNISPKIPIKHLLIIAGYYGIATLIVGLSLDSFLNHFIGAEGSDIYEMARGAWWFKYALVNGEPLYYQTLLGYPDGIDGSVLISVPTQYLPISLLSFVLPLNVAYNIIVLLWMALNGWAMYWLMRYLLNDEGDVPALLAGLIYMAFPLFQGHLFDAHAGLMIAWPAPLYLWALFRLVNAKSQVWHWILLGVLFFYLTTTGHPLLTIYVLLPITALFGLARLYQRDWTGMLRIFIMGIIASAIVMVIMIPAIRDATSEAAYTETQGFVRYSTDALAIISPSFFHPLFNNVAYSRDILGTNLGEGFAYIGFIVGLLVIIGLLKNRDSRWWLLLAVVTWVLSLGSLLKFRNVPVMLSLEQYETYITLPFAFLQNLPVFNLARTPARFTFTLAIAVAVMAGYGAAWLWQWRWQLKQRWRYGLALLIAVLIVVEYKSFWPQPTVPADMPQAVYDLRVRDDVRAVFNVPYQHTLAAKDALFYQTRHQHPLIAGQITRQTPVNPAKLAILQATFDPALLHPAGVDIVIFHRYRAQEIGELETLQVQLEAQLGGAIYTDDRISIFEVTEPDANPSDMIALSTSGSTESLASLHFFAPQSGWIDLTGTLQADGRTVELLMDGQVIHRWQIAESIDIHLPIHVPERGYYTVNLHLTPPCPLYDTQVLTCKNLTYALEASFINDDIESVTFDDGIILRDANVTVSDSLDVRLMWQFDKPRTDGDIRFVHVVDAAGEIIQQSDIPLGNFEADTRWTEAVSFTLDALPAGDYTVRVGWYDFDTVTNYQTDGQLFAIIGTVSIGE